MRLPKSQIKRFLIYGLCCIAVIFGAARLYYRLTDDFRLANISEQIAYRPEWATAMLTEEEKFQLLSILDQPFHYIGKGAQSYAFSSEDDQYVIKFFKFKHLRPSPFLDWLPPLPFIESYRKKQAARKIRKFEGVFSGYHLAFHEHRKESGLIHVHLNLTKDQFPEVVLYDKIGRKHLISLDEVPFLIQRKGETLRTVFSKLLAQGDLKQAQLKVSQIFDLYLSEYQKGLFDHDHGVMHNTGFAGEHPIHLDVGKLKKDNHMKEKEIFSQDIVLMAERMAQWFQKTYPVEYPEIALHIEKNVSQMIDQPFKLP